MKSNNKPVILYIIITLILSLGLISCKTTQDKSGRDILDELFPNGSWNIPASEINIDSSRQWMVDELYNNASDRPGNINISYDWYTYPIYIADEDTPHYEVISENPDWGNVTEETVPYNDNWEASNGSDAQIIVIDPTTKKYYDIWQLGGWDWDNDQPVYDPPFNNGKLYVGNGNRIDNYETSNGISGSRGCGIAYFNMLARPEEVERGVINHALSMPIYNASSEFVPPAVKSDGYIDGGIPQGTRFALTMTNEELNSWIESKTEYLRPLAKALGYALRDYG
jgi:hypothetical protein